jgi:SAM-dependent methyltransferase
MSESLQRRVLEDLEGARNYNAWVASLALPYLGEDPIEIGSGIGTFSRLWLESGIPRLTVSDLEPEMVEQLRKAFAGNERVTVTSLDLLDAPSAEYSAVVALNVLEHIRDDVAALRAAARLVRPGGAVVVFVPAFPFAMSRFDRSIGHHRRYTIDTMRRSFVGADLALEDVRYVNAPGLLAWVVGMRLLRMTPREGVALRTWDRLVVPLTRTLERRWSPPAGQSVLAVGRAVA